jgi:tetraacyldisaccharide 4'-kinase
LGLLSAIYCSGLSCKRFFYTQLKKPDRLPARVISIGNLTLGGTGKTPAVISLAREAKKRSFYPCVLTRGYKGKTKDVCFVSKGEGPVLNASQSGDEPYLMAEALNDIPIIKGKNRYMGGMFAIKNLKSEIQNMKSEILFILDDGFQHWRLHRDIDVLLIDATNPFGNEKIFPEGIMREPFNVLKRAHIIVLTKSDTGDKEKISAITQKIRKYNQEAPVFTASHKPTGLTDASGNTRELDTLLNKKIYSFAGISNPVYFQSLLHSKGADIVEFRKFRDHYAYRQKDMDEIKKDALGLEIITTEKDLVKLKELQVPDNIYALKIEFLIDNEFYDYIFRRL